MSSRVLIVEDDVDLGETLQDILREEGYEVSLAQNGEHGLELIAHTNPDVVLLDMCLPRRTGYDILKYMERHPLRCNIPVVVNTADTAEIESKLVLNVMRKPMSTENLLKTVELAVKHGLNG